MGQSVVGSVDTSLIKCCGISTKRDGTENELIFDYDRLSVLSNQSNQVVTTDADVEEQTLRESQEFIPIVNNYKLSMKKSATIIMMRMS